MYSGTYLLNFNSIYNMLAILPFYLFLTEASMFQKIKQTPSTSLSWYQHIIGLIAQPEENMQATTGE